MICPALKEKRGYEFLECDVHEDTVDDLYMYGQQTDTITNLTTTTYTFDNLANGSYYFKLVAYDGKGNNRSLYFFSSYGTV